MVLLINKTVWHVVGLTTLLVTGGWCLYFDQKRRKQGQERTYEREISTMTLTTSPSNDFPSIGKPPKSLRKRPSKDALQSFFLQEIDYGEQLLMVGDMEGSVEHFVNAIVVCENPGELLRVLRQTLPRPIYKLVKAEIGMLSV